MAQFMEKFRSQTAHCTRLVTRRKTDEDDGNPETSSEGSNQLAKCLGLWDLTMLGVGTTLGVGVYVLAGAVARDNAGPAVVLSFLIAAIASALAGVCYAEFAARVPRAGSAYVYSYITVGELAAFLIGWNIILEYVIGNASVARAFIALIDSRTNQTMKTFLLDNIPMHFSQHLSPYPDFPSFIVILLLSVLIAWGVRESSYLNNFFTTANLITVGIVIISGAFYWNVDNWRIEKVDYPEFDSDNKTMIDRGEGGFFPFGFVGVMTGAAKCFYGFVGFDCVATMGEEAKNPKRDIPLAIVLCLLITCAAYLGVASTLTLMVPYYLQNTEAPIPFVFQVVGLKSIEYIVFAGSLFAVFTGLLGGMFPMPRILYAMSYDGLLFQSLKAIHPRTKTPVFATMVSGAFAGVMACLFNLTQLMDMMSIGTLLAYTIVALCVLILRYRNHQNAIEERPKEDCGFTVSFGDLFNHKNIKRTNRTTESVALWALTGFI